VFVSAEWLAQHRGDRDVIVVDARTPERYAEGHVPGAISIAPALIGDAPQPAATLGRRGLAAGATIVCVGDSASAAAAAHLAWLLDREGGRAVRILDGGLSAWARAGGTLETEAVFREPTQWGAAADTTLIADREFIRWEFGRPGVEILDTRGAEVWGARRPGAGPARPMRAGHIPNSLPIDPASLFAPDGTVLDSAKVRDRVRQSGPRPGTPVDLAARFVVYDDGVSGSGALGYAVLRHAGLHPVRYFPGGWAEWSADTTLPIVRIVDAAAVRGRMRLWRVRSPETERPSDFLLLDVRDRFDYGRGHLRGALDFPSHVFADSVEDWLEECCGPIDRAHTPVVFYCYGVDCIRSRLCATIAARKGFRILEWFRGGMEEWLSLGGEVIEGSARPK
jgi:thiosulfate/3-mercaptopyruvate sulfurtransferase